jgi:hypothetical protein
MLLYQSKHNTSVSPGYAGAAPSELHHSTGRCFVEGNRFWTAAGAGGRLPPDGVVEAFRVGEAFFKRSD